MIEPCIVCGGGLPGQMKMCSECQERALQPGISGREIVRELAKAIVFRYQTNEVRQAMAAGITKRLRGVTLADVMAVDSYNMVLVMTNGDRVML